MKESMCYIFAAGDFDGSIEKHDGDIIIAADAGYRHLEKLNICPDIILGDFDTIGSIPAHHDIRQFPKEKDYTDTELAISEAIKLGYKKFTICGAVGGKRLEHTVANLVLASSYAEKGYDITLTDGRYVIKAIHNSQVLFTGDEIGFVSVFTLSGKAEGVFEHGLKYTLENAVLDSSNPTLGVSNEFIGQRACISVKNGTLLIIWQNGIK